MTYFKYDLQTKVLWRGKVVTIVGIQHGHSRKANVGNIYTVRFDTGMRHFDYPSIPESELSPLDEPMTVEDVTYVANSYGSALPCRHVPKLVKS